MAIREFVIGDIHGGYKALVQVLDRAQITEDDKLIFLGDFVDGWSEAPEVLSKLIELQNSHNCVFIRGNHDRLLETWFETHQRNEMWLEHGGQATLEAYEDISRMKIGIHKRFLASLENYHIDRKNRLFVHAGFANQGGPKNEYYQHVFYWDRSLWETALATDPALKKDDFRYPKRFTHFKEIFIGHTPTTRINSTSPVNYLNLWNVDTGAAFKGPLSMMEINTKEVFQSDPVYELYPDEQGRNRD